MSKAVPRARAWRGIWVYWLVGLGGGGGRRSGAGERASRRDDPMRGGFFRWDGEEGGGSGVCIS